MSQADALQDYAVVSRYRDPVTGSLVLQIAGLGLHGTGMATEFVLAARYIDGLGQRLKTCGRTCSSSCKRRLWTELLDNLIWLTSIADEDRQFRAA